MTLTAVASRLRCPVCHERLAAAPGRLTCRRRHSYDVARHGYVNLTAPRGRASQGDDARMVAARVHVQDAGHFEPLTAALTHAVTRLGELASSVVLDVGAGTGHHLANILDVLPESLGIALDCSRDASRRAARAHERLAAVRSDVWQQIPLADASVGLALSVFAPKNGAELARVLRPGGTLMVVTPAPEHLRELAGLHAIHIDPFKSERLHRRVGAVLRASGFRRISWTLKLTRQEAEALLCMGPAARHLAADVTDRLAALSQPVLVTGAVELRTFLRPGTVTDQAGASSPRSMPASSERDAMLSFAKTFRRW
jgi:SAM-dependent methyltransferase